jgi:hypothetical protein
MNFVTQKQHHDGTLALLRAHHAPMRVSGLRETWAAFNTVAPWAIAACLVTFGILVVADTGKSR